MKAAELVMLQTWRRPAKLFSDFHTLQFASVMSLVVFVILLFLMTAPPHHHAISTDLPKVNHPVSMPWAARDDAMTVAITRDGKVFLGGDLVNSAELPMKIADRLKDRDVEWKVYIVADMRARWGSIKPVLDGVHAAGIRRIAFLVDQRRSAAFPL